MATKFKTVSATGATHRIFEGQLRVCASDSKKNYKMQVMLLNDEVTLNQWRYTRVAEHAHEAEDIPLLYSVINGKVGNSHDFEIVTDKFGNQYASFIGAESEHPYGWLPSVVNGEPNARMENIDGTDWLTATAYLPSFYNKEMIDELNKNGGRMPISIETLVTKSHMEGNIEVEDEYSIVGVTILGVSTTPAVPGANIRKLALNGQTLKELKLRVASLASADSNTEPQLNNKKQEKENRKSMKFLTMDDLNGKFNGYTPVKISGRTVALISDTGRFCSYTFLENEDTVVPERIEGIAVNCVFGEGDNAITVSGDELIGVYRSQLNAAQSALEKTTKETTEKINALEAKLNKMTEAENKRRREAVKAAIRDELKANQNCGVEIADNFCDDLLTDECIGKYAEMVDANDCFVGAERARECVGARCMERIRNGFKEQARRNAEQEHFSWANVIGKAAEGESDDDVDASVRNILG